MNTPTRWARFYQLHYRKGCLDYMKNCRHHTGWGKGLPVDKWVNETNTNALYILWKVFDIVNHSKLLPDSISPQSEWHKTRHNKWCEECVRVEVTFIAGRVEPSSAIIEISIYVHHNGTYFNCKRKVKFAGKCMEWESVMAHEATQIKTECALI